MQKVYYVNKSIRNNHYNQYDEHIYKEKKPAENFYNIQLHSLTNDMICIRMYHKNCVVFLLASIVRMMM